MKLGELIDKLTEMRDNRKCPDEMEMSVLVETSTEAVEHIDTVEHDVVYAVGKSSSGTNVVMLRSH